MLASDEDSWILVSNFTVFTEFEPYLHTGKLKHKVVFMLKKFLPVAGMIFVICKVIRSRRKIER